MRSLSVLASLIGKAFRIALAQVMAECDPFVEHKAFAAPAARALRHRFEIFQDAALEVINFLESAREQIGAGLFAADTAGAEHRDLFMLLRIEGARGEILELAKAFDA